MKSTVKMEVLHIDLLYDCVKLLKPLNVIETGVALDGLVYQFSKLYQKIKMVN